MRARIPAVLMLGATTLAIATPCAAQIEVTPVVGLYNPAEVLYQVPVVCTQGMCAQGPGLPVRTATQRSSFAVGMHVTDWTNEWIALDFSLRTAESSTKDSEFGTSAPFALTAGSVGFAFRLPPPPWQVAPIFELEGALGFVTRGGAVFQASGAGPAQTDWGPVIGGSIRFPLTERLAVRCDIEDFIYWFSAYAGPYEHGTLTSQVQHDVVISAGLAIQVGRSMSREPSGQR